MPERFLRSLPDEALTTEAIKELRKFKNSLIRLSEQTPQGVSGNHNPDAVTNLLVQQYAHNFDKLNTSGIIVPMSCAVDYCITMPSMQEQSADEMGISDMCMNTVDNALSRGGIGHIWNGLGITCHKQRQNVFEKALRVVLSNTAAFTKEEYQTIHQFDLGRIIACNLVGLDVDQFGMDEQNPMHPYLACLDLDFLLHDDRQTKREAAHEFTRKLKEEGVVDGRLFIRWPATLCQAASLKGYPAEVIFRGVEPIIEGILDAMGYYSNDQKQVYIHRFKVVTAMGFDNLIDSLEVRREDLLVLDSSEHVNPMLELLAASPLSHEFLSNSFNVVYANLVQSLERSGLHVDLDLVMDIDGSPTLDLFLTRSLLHAHVYTADDRSQSMHKAVNHPDWLKNERLSLPPLDEFDSMESKEVIAMHGARVAHGIKGPSLHKMLPDMVRKREGRLFSYSEQEDMVRFLIDKELLSPEACDYLKIDDAVIRQFKQHLDDVMKSHLLHSQLSI